MHSITCIGRRRALIAAGAAWWALPRAHAAPPALLLANVYRAGIALEAYWASEKYDGVRAYWDGVRLSTRGGERIAAPAWFTAGWPATPMDGELWAGRGRFEHASATARRLDADDGAWRAMRFMVFDVPAQPGSFDQRLPVLVAAVAAAGQPWVQAVPQRRVVSHAELAAWMRQVVRDGGEGLMLHRGDAPYRGGRSDDLLKVKPHEDAEARVIAHLPGEGRHAGRVGALLVETPEGRRFRLGTGLSDADRERPPAIGSWVTYRYRGTHGGGLPRFASFLRVREGYAPP